MSRLAAIVVVVLFVFVGPSAVVVAATSSQTASSQMERVFALENANLDIDGVDDVRVDVDVAVLDAGVQLGHPDLNVVAGADCMGAVAPSYQCTTGPGDGDDKWTHGHGTGVAERIAAIDNAIGWTVGASGVGVAAGARLWAVDVVHSPDFFSPLAQAHWNWVNNEPWDPVPVDLEPWIAGVKYVTAHAEEIEVMHIAATS